MPSFLALAPVAQQMLPITGVSEQLLEPRWVQQMLPSFEESCLYDSNPIKACVVEGWSMLVHAGQAITGRCGCMSVAADVTVATILQWCVLSWRL